jgi:hypothetical protein
MMASQGDGAAAGERRARKPAGVLARVVWFYMAGVTTALLIAFTGLGVAVVVRWPQLPPALLAVAALAAAVTGLWDREIYRRTLSPPIDAWRSAAHEAAG